MGDNVDYVLVPYNKGNNSNIVSYNKNKNGNTNISRNSHSHNNSHSKHLVKYNKNYNKGHNQHNQHKGRHQDNSEPFMVGMRPIWKKITNQNKHEFQNFVSCCGTQFSRIINDHTYVICSSVAKKKRLFGWDNRLVVLVKTGDFKTLYEFSGNDKDKYEYHNVDSKFRVLSKDLESSNTQYSCLIIGKNGITIRFENDKERNKWKYILSSQ